MRLVLALIAAVSIGAWVWYFAVVSEKRQSYSIPHVALDFPLQPLPPAPPITSPAKPPVASLPKSAAPLALDPAIANHPEVRAYPDEAISLDGELITYGFGPPIMFKTLPDGRIVRDVK